MLLTEFPGGTFVSIPLSILQSNYYHLHTGTYLTKFDQLIPLNICMAHAIYDWDRKKDEDNPGVKNIYEKTTSAALVTASCILSSVEELTFFVPFLFILYNFYDDIKIKFSIVKPFIVSFFWTCAIYLIPTLLQDYANIYDLYTPLSSFLLMAGWSNIADLKDIDEDIMNDIFTPSTYLKRDDSLKLSGVLIMMSFFLDVQSTYYDANHAVFNSLNLLVFIIVCVIYVIEQ